MHLSSGRAMRALPLASIAVPSLAALGAGALVWLGVNASLAAGLASAGTVWGIGSLTRRVRLHTTRLWCQDRGEVLPWDEERAVACISAGIVLAALLPSVPGAWGVPMCVGAIVAAGYFFAS